MSKKKNAKGAMSKDTVRASRGPFVSKSGVSVRDCCRLDPDTDDLITALESPFSAKEQLHLPDSPVALSHCHMWETYGTGSCGTSLSNGRIGVICLSPKSASTTTNNCYAFSSGAWAASDIPSPGDGTTVGITFGKATTAPYADSAIGVDVTDVQFRPVAAALAVKYNGRRDEAGGLLYMASQLAGVSSDAISTYTAANVTAHPGIWFSEPFGDGKWHTTGWVNVIAGWEESAPTTPKTQLAALIFPAVDSASFQYRIRVWFEYRGAITGPATVAHSDPIGWAALQNALVTRAQSRVRPGAGPGLRQETHQLLASKVSAGWSILDNLPSAATIGRWAGKAKSMYTAYKAATSMLPASRAYPLLLN